MRTSPPEEEAGDPQVKKRRRDPNEPVTPEELEWLRKEYHMDHTFRRLSELTGVRRDPVTLADLPAGTADAPAEIEGQPESDEAHSGITPETGVLHSGITQETGVFPEHIPLETGDIPTRKTPESKPAPSSRQGSTPETGVLHSGITQETGVLHSGITQETGVMHSGKTQETGVFHSSKTQENGVIPQNPPVPGISLDALRKNPLAAWRQVPLDLVERLGRIILDDPFRVD